MEPNEQIPGVTFYLEESRQLPPPMTEPDAVSSAEARLRAIVYDQSVWDEVILKLKCLRIYTVKNLAEQMVDLAQRKVKASEEQLEMFSAEVTGELEQLRQRVSFLEHENQQLRLANNQWARWAETVSPKQPSEG